MSSIKEIRGKRFSPWSISFWKKAKVSNYFSTDVKYIFVGVDMVLKRGPARRRSTRDFFSMHWTLQIGVSSSCNYSTHFTQKPICLLCSVPAILPITRMFQATSYSLLTIHKWNSRHHLPRGINTLSQEGHPQSFWYLLLF